MTGLGILLAVVGIALFLAPFFGAKFGRVPRQLSIALLIVGALLAIFAQAFVVVPNGRIGVVFNTFSGVKPGGLIPGAHIIVPFVENVAYYDVQLRERTLSRRGEGGPNIDESIKALSKEGLEISADVTVQYQVKVAEITSLHKEIGPDFVDRVIIPQVRSEFRDMVGQFNANQLISTGRGELRGRVEAGLRDVFNQRHLVLVSALIRELRIPDSIAKAIEEKQAAEQQVQTEQNRLRQARIAAQRSVVQAEGEAKATIARANGEAKSLSLRGQALRANPEIIQLTAAEKLSPSVQTILLPSTGNFLLDLAGMTKRAK